MSVDLTLSCAKTMGTSDDSSSGGKSGKWSLGKDVTKNPPLLEDMGLCPLRDCESELLDHVPFSQIIQPSSQNNKNFPAVFIQNDSNSEEFFVFKRRKLDTVSGEDKFNKLIEEVVLMIFKWLPKYMLARCAQVCKRWKRFAFDESLWRRLDLGSRTLNPGVIGRVLLRGTFSLRLAQAEISSPLFCPSLQYLNTQTEIKTRLQNLDLSMAAIQPEALSEILSVCNQLKRISLEHCTVTDECLNYLSRNPLLTTLNLSMCYGLSGEGLLPILTQCTKLQALNIAWTSLDSKDLSVICKNVPPSLLRLNISGFRHTLSDCHIRQLSNRAPFLLELDVSERFSAHFGTVNTIITKLPELELFGLRQMLQHHTQFVSRAGDDGEPSLPGGTRHLEREGRRDGEGESSQHQSEPVQLLFDRAPDGRHPSHVHLGFPGQRLTAESVTCLAWGWVGS
ncbi:UNVERIFIED_CONTAM: hypothetical protein GTU68_007949 [Idotea baltica]|nr:hypothetical protein [Idotea baltica]